MKPDDAPQLDQAFQAAADFHNVRAICPHCSAVSIFLQPVHNDLEGPKIGERQPVTAVRIGVCQACNGIVFGVRLRQGDEGVLL